MSRTTKYHYSLGRFCSQCEKPITNSSKLGLCRECFLDLREHRSAGGESSAHRELKKRAIEFLKSLGCQNIRKEIRIGKYPSTSVCDTIGENSEGAVIVVECGGSLYNKLLKIASIVDAIYILPYGEKTPYLWNNSLKICRGCGHTTDENTILYQLDN